MKAGNAQEQNGENGSQAVAGPAVSRPPKCDRVCHVHHEEIHLPATLTTFLGGTMRRMPPAPTVCGMTLPSFFTATVQNKFRCEPGEQEGSTEILNTTSLSSFEICISGTVTFAGKPTSFTMALPSKGICWSRRTT